MSVKSWLEVEAMWDELPLEIRKSFHELQEELGIRETMKNGLIKIFEGSTSELSTFGFDIAEEIPNSKKYFKRIEQFDKGVNGTYVSDLLDGKY